MYQFEQFNHFAQIEFLSNGVKVIQNSEDIVFKNEKERVEKKKARRGCVNTFSFKSSRRLREILINWSLLDGQKFLSFTLTLPCEISSENWALLVKRFFKRLSSHSFPVVWRVELQKRKVPHLHCVSVVRTVLDVGKIFDCWVGSCDSISDSDGISITRHNGFLLYSFVAKWVRNENWFVYVATHTCKHKQSQLGWIGRQWGLVNRTFYHSNSSQSINLEGKNFVWFCRLIRRRFHYKKFNVNFFGSRLFFGRACIERFLQYIGSSYDNNPLE